LADAALPFHSRHPLDSSLSSCPAADAGSYVRGMAVRLADLGEVSVMSLHSIAEAGAWSWVYKFIQDTQLSYSCEKKIKKDLTNRIEWDIKGLLTRKTKGK
jgi:hypothetical protein